MAEIAHLQRKSGRTMGSLEDHYAAREASTRAAANTSFVPAYNRFTDIIREITTEMHARFTANPPDDYEWIAVEGNKLVGWQLWSNWEADEAVHLLSNGRVAYTTGRSGHRKLKLMVSLRHISKPLTPSQFWKNGALPLVVLRDLCKSVVCKPINHGFANDPRHKGWLRDGSPSS